MSVLVDINVLTRLLPKRHSLAIERASKDKIPLTPDIFELLLGGWQKETMRKAIVNSPTGLSSMPEGLKTPYYYILDGEPQVVSDTDNHSVAYYEELYRESYDTSRVSITKAINYGVFSKSDVLAFGIQVDELTLREIDDDTDLRVRLLTRGGLTPSENKQRDFLYASIVASFNNLLFCTDKDMIDNNEPFRSMLEYRYLDDEPIKAYLTASTMFNKSQAQEIREYIQLRYEDNKESTFRQRVDKLIVRGDDLKAFEELMRIDPELRNEYIDATLLGTIYSTFMSAISEYGNGTFVKDVIPDRRRAVEVNRELSSKAEPESFVANYSESVGEIISDELPTMSEDEFHEEIYKLIDNRDSRGLRTIPQADRNKYLDATTMYILYNSPWNEKVDFAKLIKDLAKRREVYAELVTRATPGSELEREVKKELAKIYKYTSIGSTNALRYRILNIAGVTGVKQQYKDILILEPSGRNKYITLEILEVVHENFQREIARDPSIVAKFIPDTVKALTLHRQLLSIIDSEPEYELMIANIKRVIRLLEKEKKELPQIVRTESDKTGGVH